MKNLPLFIVLCFSIVGNLYDLVTTLLVGTGESNPLFILFGNSVIPIIVIKGLATYSFIWMYNIKNYKTNFTYYTAVAVMVMFTALVFFAAITNTYALTQPDIMERAATMSNAEKTSGYMTFISIGYIIPMIFNMLIFWIYDKSRPNVRINKDG